MEEKFTKSYGIKRIAELTEENTRLNKQIKFLENEYKIRIDSHKQFYEELLAAKNNEIKRLNYIANNNKTVAMLVASEKIKFAIAELEKVKKLLNKNFIIYGWIPNEALSNKINEQIKELKEK